MADAALINANLERLLFTEIGSIPGRPTEGSRLPRFFWEPGNTSTVHDIIKEITYLITTYETRITMNTLSVNIKNVSPTMQGLIINITYKINSDIKEKTNTFESVKILEVA